MDDPKYQSPESRREPWRTSVLTRFYKVINEDYCQAQNLQIALAELLGSTLATQQTGYISAKDLIETWSSSEYTFDVRDGSDDNSAVALLERPSDKSIDDQRRDSNIRRAELVTKVMAYLGTSEHVVLDSGERVLLFSHALANLKRYLGDNVLARQKLGAEVNEQFAWAVMTGGGRHISDVALAMTDVGFMDKETLQKYISGED